ncbi:hypothetical protein CCYA_CCYA03G0880 [Cyanidiococcus yangmingshanensis]|nr:hypothetical protein CCYA_CCYA03G0880 [Cyanidiococcus yangmingshanensis]
MDSVQGAHTTRNCSSTATFGEEETQALQVLLQGRTGGHNWSDRRCALDRLCELVKKTPSLLWDNSCPDLQGESAAARLGAALCQHAEELRPSIVASACRLSQEIANALHRFLNAEDSERCSALRSWAATFSAQVQPGLLSAATGHVTSATASAQAALEALETLSARLGSTTGVHKTNNHRRKSPEATLTVQPPISTDVRGTGAGVRAAPSSENVPVAAAAAAETADLSTNAGSRTDIDVELEKWTAPMAGTGNNVLDYSLSVRKHVSVVAQNRRHSSTEQPHFDSEGRLTGYRTPLQSSDADKENADDETTTVDSTGSASIRQPFRSNELATVMHHQKLESKADTEAALAEKNRELTAILQQYEATLEKLIESDSQSQTCSVRSKLLTLETENNQLKADLLTCTEAFEQLRARYRDLKGRFGAAQSNEQRATATAQMATQRMDEMERYLREFKQHAEQKLALAFQHVSQAKNEITTKEAMIASMEKALETKRTACEEKDAAITEAMNMYRRAERDQEQLRARLSALEHEMQALRSRAQTAESELEVLRSELAVGGPGAPLRDGANTLQQRLDELHSTLAALQAKEDASRRELERLTNENQTLKARTYDHIQEIESLRAALHASQASSKQEAPSDREELGHLRAENEELHQLCNALLEKLEALETATKPPA